MPIQSPEIISAAVDWITVTSSTPDHTEYLLGEGHRLLQQEVRNGATEQKSGFQGYTGRAAGSVFWGLRKDGALLRHSGPGAHSTCELLDWARVKATRVDVQVTARYGEYHDDLAARTSQLVSERQKMDDPRVPPSPDFRKRHGRGDEFRVGARSSPRYGRLYDKWRESGEDWAKYAWRWECEFKKMVAPATVLTLARHGWSPEACASVVNAQWRAWHLNPPWRGGALPVAGSIGRRDSDPERVLRWLKTQVAPAVEKLIVAGYEDAALTALGWNRNA